MKREIKFRAKSIDTGKWIYGYGMVLLPDSEDGLIIHKQGCNLAQNSLIVPDTMGQYTGLKDKNGQEIYEGDVDQDGGIVFWLKDEAAFCINYPGIEVQPLISPDAWMEIKTNIYESPELLSNERI